MIKPPRIAPSVLAADFSRLGEEVARVEPHADLLHVDVMDGHFVPNLAVGIPVIASLRKITKLPLDCHLMTLNPDRYLEALKEAGADIVTVHIEVFPNPADIAAQARAVGLGFGLAINPPTPVLAVEPFVELTDMVLVMSVDPGFGGQQFDQTVLGKVERLRKFVDSAGLGTDIEIDGGIDLTTIRPARDAGADVFVAGTSVFRTDDPAAAIQELREAMIV
ncbi:MAG: ribulose-phosphate 3-epimerase [Actinobacteria bacterium]|nr:ribulose-phosphate 3-epimerase [Actinomycetota bacterium]